VPSATQQASGSQVTITPAVAGTTTS
jgi:hypothetical protein